MECALYQMYEIIIIIIIIITKTSATSFEVKSEHKDRKYHVDISGNIPSCECEDWDMYHLPCKHMLAALSMVEDMDWECVASMYTTAQCLILTIIWSVITL